MARYVIVDSAGKRVPVGDVGYLAINRYDDYVQALVDLGWECWTEKLETRCTKDGRTRIIRLVKEGV